MLKNTGNGVSSHAETPPSGARDYDPLKGGSVGKHSPEVGWKAKSFGHGADNAPFHQGPSGDPLNK